MMLVLVLHPSLSTAQVVINEGSNKNYTSIPDEDYEFPDWIELYNAGSAALDLYQYSLTDDQDDPAKWVLPHMVLAQGGYQVIYCSGKDRVFSPPFTTVINTGTFSPATGWNTHVFTTPFYWNGTSNVVINVCSFSSLGYTVNSVFKQSATSYYSTTVAFQDGSPASCSSDYGTTVKQRPNMKINGKIIGTGSIENSPYDYPAPYGNWYWGARNEMLIPASELNAAGLTAGFIDSMAFEVTSPDPAIYDYIEITMDTTTATAMSSEFLNVNGSGYHTNFKLSGSGETVYLYDPSQVLVSNLPVNCMSSDVSVGTKPDGSSSLSLFSPATPGSSNDTSTPYSTFAAAPTYSVNSGFYSSPFSVTITNPNASSTLYYTLDGSDPTPSSIPDTGQAIFIYQSTVLRARAFVNGALPSAIAVATYFFNVNHITPILSVTTDNNNLYGPSGIFDNYNEDWLKAAYVEYFDSTELHHLIFSEPAGMIIDGGAGGSRSQPQHSFRLEMGNGVLGGGTVEYPVIPDKPGRTHYSDFYLRNGSNQYLILPYKDAAQVKMMSKGLNNYYSAWRPVSVYINGQYFGLYELREKFNNEMFEEADTASSSSISLLSLSYFYGSVLRALSGSVDSFWNDYALFSNLDATDTGFWNLADHYFDLLYYTDYIIGESWMGNVDWPQNNIKIYRSDATNNRWRFCITDQELALAPNSWTDCSYDHIGYMLGWGDSEPYRGIWFKALQNERYKNYFINRFADVMNTTYQTDNLLAIENAMFDQTIVEMQNEYQRWGDPWNVPAEIDDFYNNHLIFQSELACRPATVRDDIQNNFELPRQVDLTLDVFPEGAGTIHISTIVPSSYPWHGIYFDGVPVKIEAVANDGYSFSHWKKNTLLNDTLNETFNAHLSIDSVLFMAYFDSLVSGTENIHAASPDFSLYPSLTEHSMTLHQASTLQPGHFTYEIIDLNGKTLLRGLLNSQTGETNIDVHTLPAGMYFLRIMNDHQVIKHLRFVKAGI